MKQKTFITLIEILIVAIVGVVALKIFLDVTGDSSNDKYSYGVNGITETRCINDMKFAVGQSGSVQQILGPNGGGVPCQ